MNNGWAGFRPGGAAGLSADAVPPGEAPAPLKARQDTRDRQPGPPAPAGSAWSAAPAALAAPPGRQRSLAVALVAAARPRQWVKNLLVFAAPATAGVLSRPVEVGRVVAAVAILLAASAGVYLVNDVIDAPADRAHPDKRMRPVASGELPVPAALTAAAAALALSLAASAVVAGTALAAITAAYVVVSVSYSLWLKRLAVIELGCVASGFLLRAAAGGAAAHVVLSPWFILVVSAAALLVVAGKRAAEQEKLSGSAVSHRPVLARYPAPFLLAVRLIAASVAITGYALWAFGRAGHLGTGHVGGTVFELSILPFVLGVLVVELSVEVGGASAPEELVLSNHTLQVLGLACAALVAVGVYT